MRGLSRIRSYALMAGLGFLSLGLGLGSPMPAQGEWKDPPVVTQWGATVRGGASFFSDDLDNSTFKRSFLRTFNGQIFYNLVGPRGRMGHDWNLGINADYEHHELDGTQAKIKVLTVMPFMEFRTRYNHWAPYVSAGAGVNFNAVTNEPPGFEVTAKNSLALKFGLGADWFITDHIAINTEAAWKLNNPDFKGSLAGTTLGSGNMDISVVQVLAGLRLYFGQ
jgi:opacity protein-like surface antigen